MQAKAIMKKDSNVKIRYSGIKFLYISSSASHKPFLCEQRIRKRKLFIPTHTKLVSASHSEHNSSFHIKAKSNIFFYNSTDIMSIGGRRRRKEEQKKKWNQQVVFFFPQHNISQSYDLFSLDEFSVLYLHSLSLSLFPP